MRRFFTVLEGPGKGSEKPLDKSYMLVGRSHVADVQIEGDDLLISRRHLEVRIKDEEVFVKDISSKGSLLNGQRVKGEVSLNPGDILDLGQTKLRYQEVVADEPAAEDPGTKEGPAAQGDRTRVANDRTRVAPPGMAGRPAAPDPDATHAVVEDDTRMLKPGELPGWKAPVAKGAKSRAPLWFGLGLVLILAAAGGGYWYLNGGGAAANSGPTEFKDSGLGFSMEYPADWSRIPSKPDVITFGYGKENSAEWARVNVYADKKSQYSITGLSTGFAEYREVLKKQFKEFELAGKERRTFNDMEIVFFGFSSGEVEGVGVYTLNSDTRLVVQCFSPRKNHQRFESAFDSILKSFHLTAGDNQQCIDFPLPDANMKRLALASPSELAREVDEHARVAEALLASQAVRPDNLFRSVHEYGQALQLAVAGPQPLPPYRKLAEGMRRATQLYNQAVQRQRFEISRALRAKDQATAYWAANRLMQMVPEKATPAYQEAYKVFRALEPEK